MGNKPIDESRAAENPSEKKRQINKLNLDTFCLSGVEIVRYVLGVRRSSFLHVRYGPVVDQYGVALIELDKHTESCETCPTKDQVSLANILESDYG